MPSRSAARLDALVACGVRVRVLGGAGKRYAFHHPKYAIADDRAVVLTENWKPSGTGGADNRGWGVRVRDAKVADALVATFDADAGAHDATDWQRYRAGRTFVPPAAPVPTTRFPTTVPPQEIHAERVALVVAPDNAEPAFERLLAGANRSIRVIQPTIGSAGHPLLRASVDAARRGVRVQILLGAAWYVSEQNRALADQLNRRARQEGLPLKVRIVTPRSRFGTIHAKGVIIDGETVVVGSPNWTNTSLRQNREVALVLTGSDVATYYVQVFQADWRGGRWRLPVGLAGAAVAT